MLQIPLRIGDSLIPVATRSDSRGRYFLDESPSEKWEDLLSASANLTLFGRYRDWVAARPLPAGFAKGTVLRLDLGLEPGRISKGRALDESGAPLSQLPMQFVPDWIRSDAPIWFLDDQVVTDSEGVFEMTGLFDLDYLVSGLASAAVVNFGRVRPSETPITLTPKPAE